MKDRVVEFPNRYRLVPVAGQENTYDFVAVPGEITEAGTIINKANLLTDETAARFGLSGNPSVNDAFIGVDITKENKSTTTTATLLASAWVQDGEEYSQTVAVEGMTGIKNIVVGPAPENHVTYNAAGVYCYAQDVGALTFRAIEVPEADMIANILAVGG